MDRQTELDRLKNMDIEQCEPDQLVDLRSVSIDKALPIRDRLCSFWEQVKNPYLFKVDAPGAVTVPIPCPSAIRASGTAPSLY